MNLVRLIVFTAIFSATTLSLFGKEKKRPFPNSVDCMELAFPIKRGAYYNTAKFKADISFMIADMKYRPGGLKILELGEGPRSVFTGYDDLIDLGIKKRGLKIWSAFWYYLRQFNLPVWLVTDRLSGHHPYGKRVLFSQQIDFPTFLKLNYRLARSLRTLRKDQLFKRISQRKKRSFKIRDYKGIIIIKYHNYSNLNHDISTCKKCADVNNLKNEFPNFLYVDEAVRFQANNKNLADLLFKKDKELKQFRPQCEVYQKQYTKTLAHRIMRDIVSDVYVIKPLNAAKGHGVIVVDKVFLDQTLKDILLKTDEIKETDDETYSYWLRDTNSQFIVESFERSKFININGKRFDATLRAIFTLHHDWKKIYVNFLGWYWKLPEKSVDDLGTMTERAKSSFKHEATRTCSTLVDNVDIIGAKMMLRKILPKLYLKMLKMKRKT